MYFNKIKIGIVSENTRQNQYSDKCKYMYIYLYLLYLYIYIHVYIYNVPI